MKVYITKFALTKGIVVADAEPDPKSKEHVHVRGAYPWDWTRFGLGDWHVDKSRALERARSMAGAQAAKLEKQARELNERQFTVPDLV